MLERTPVTEKEKTLLWGWDHRLWPYMAKEDPLALATALRKRLRERSLAERDQAAATADADEASALHHRRAGLYESAVRGWDRVIAHLARQRAQVA